MCVAFALMLASAVVQATQCSSGAECASDGEPQSGVLLLQTQLQMNPNEGAAKPECILHVGPHKAGSSSLQLMLEDTAAMLQSDGWHQTPDFSSLTGFTFPPTAGFQGSNFQKDLPSTKNVARLAFVLQESIPNTTQPVWQTFVSWLEERARKGENIVLSSEEFDKQTVAVHIHLLVEVLRKFHTTVIITYRAFYEWVPSVYREISSTCTPINTLSSWLTPDVATTIGKDESAWTHGALYTDELVRAYAPHFDIRVLELKAAFLSTFVCSFLSAKGACAFLTNQTEKMANVKAAATGDACASQGGCLDQAVRTVLLDRTIRTATEVGLLSPSPLNADRTALTQELDALLCFCAAQKVAAERGAAAGAPRLRQHRSGR